MFSQYDDVSPASCGFPCACMCVGSAVVAHQLLPRPWAGTSSGAYSQLPREPVSWHRAPAVAEDFTQHTLPATDAHLASLFFCWWLRDVIESRCVLLSCPEVEKVTISKRGDKSNFSEGKIVIYRVVWGTGMLQALSAITVTAVLPSSLPPAQHQIAALLKHLEGRGGNSQPRAQMLCGCR